jgi:hypothetical protein
MLLTQRSDEGGSMNRSWILPAVVAWAMAFDTAPAAAQQVSAVVASSDTGSAYQQARRLY